MNKKAESIIVIILVIVVFAGVVYFLMNMKPTPGIGSNQTACTAEAMQCPDGSYVGRTGPNCEFKCPTTTTNTNTTTNLLPHVPGDVLTNNLTIICVSGYSTTVRDVPDSLRKEVFARDGVAYPQPTGTTELDHIIPLCLGGSNEANNLFVEFTPSYKEKDKLENYLCDHVCSGEINIDYAQQRIAQDWYSYYKEIYG